MSRSKPVSYSNSDKYIQLGLNIAYFRKLRGLTQEEFAEAVGISRSYLSAIEAPNVVKTISLELLFSMAECLQIDSYKLLVFRE
ncbi:MAG: helix-turn-helix transcriptional regulator [Clostridia bacterium]|nr:helix-turn-helix transcriptional regulator [Clostridia bacterium]